MPTPSNNLFLDALNRGETEPTSEYRLKTFYILFYFILHIIKYFYKFISKLYML